MDVEKEARAQLMKELDTGFDCAEEIDLVNRDGLIVRCDVLARPRESDFRGYLFAFECKRPSKEWHYVKWAKALKQSIDYVGATPTAVVPVLGSANVPVTCSFVFPAPFDTPSETSLRASELVRNGFENAIAGMFHLSLMFRCGRAGTVNLNNISHFALAIGPHQIWSSRFGFDPSAHNLLRNRRPVGSRGVKLAN